ncbi:hypothetical protein [Streptomyces sp. NPDC003635]
MEQPGGEHGSLGLRTHPSEQARAEAAREREGRLTDFGASES